MRELRPELLTGGGTVEAPTLVDARDLASLMRCDISTVHRMARDGRFPRPVQDMGQPGPGHKRQYRWLTADYVAWAKAHAVR